LPRTQRVESGVAGDEAPLAFAQEAREIPIPFTKPGGEGVAEDVGPGARGRSVQQRDLDDPTLVLLALEAVQPRPRRRRQVEVEHAAHLITGAGDHAGILRADHRMAAVAVE